MLNLYAGLLLDVPQHDVDELRDQLRQTRWSPDGPVSGWIAGTDRVELRRLVSYWQRHINGLPWRERADERWPSTAFELVELARRADARAHLDAVQSWVATEVGYQHEQETRPLSLAPALSDSPSGLLVWIVEKYRVERYTKMPRGGHFAPHEEPDPLAVDLRDFLRTLR